MDEVSRVRNIKQKFEDINFNERNQFSKNKMTLNNNSNIPKSCIESSNDDTIIFDSASDPNLYSSNHRANIKRTPAFRRDKILGRNIDTKCDNRDTTCSMVTNRVNHFNKLQSDENIRTQEFDKQCSQKDETIEKIIVSEQAVSDQNSEMKNSSNNFVKRDYPLSEKQIPVYAKIKKPQRNSKVIPKSRKPFDERERDSSDYCKIVKSKLINDETKKLENVMNRENKRTYTSNKIWNDKINEDISDTLKRVLRSPLPPGPPPKKPPRTFTAKAVSSTLSAGSIKDFRNNFFPTSANFTDGNDCHFTSNIPKPVRSKTESEIMLKKIENALLKHHTLALSPKLNARKLSDSPDSKLERFAEINKSRRRASDRGCNFELHKSEASQSAACDTKNAETDHFSSRFPVTVTHPLREKVDRHIYEVPKELKGLNNESSPVKEKLPCSLYYMSTPIDTILNSSERILLDDFVEAQNFNLKGINDLAFKENANIKIPTDISMENKIKIWMNNAYSKPWTKTSDGSSDSDSVVSVNIDDVPPRSKTDASVEEYDQVTLRRKGYVQKVASKAISRNQSIMTPFPSDYKHLFECLLLIGLDLDSGDNKVPYIKMKYPNNVDVPHWIEHMCFPDAHEWSSSTSDRLTNENGLGDERCYVVTLTTQAGQRKYVYCRRIKPEGESFSLPLCYCILTSHQAYEFYFMILEEIENRHGQIDINFKTFMKELYDHKFPIKGQSIKIYTYSEDGNFKIKEDVVERPHDSRLEDLRLAKTLKSLKINIFLTIFSSLLLERKVILLSSRISKLSTCIGGLQVALLPFHWQHTLITVVPSNLISVTDLCEAPTPYLIGLLKSKNNSTSFLSTFNNKQKVIVVDLDEEKILRKVNDEGSILPSHLSKGIKNALQLAHSSEPRTNNLLACEAFTRLFVELVGHYRRYIIPHGSDRNPKKSFQKDAFVRAASPHSVKMFLEWFVETAAFSTFIEMRIIRCSESRGLFEQRCNEYFEELNKMKYTKNKKIVKQIGDLIKDWTTAS